MTQQRQYRSYSQGLGLGSLNVVHCLTALTALIEGLLVDPGVTRLVPVDLYGAPESPGS